MLLKIDSIIRENDHPCVFNFASFVHTINYWTHL